MSEKWEDRARGARGGWCSRCAKFAHNSEREAQAVLDRLARKAEQAALGSELPMVARYLYQCGQGLWHTTRQPRNNLAPDKFRMQGAAFVQLPTGWFDLALGLHEALIELSPQYRVHVVKVSMGGLSIIFSPGDVPARVADRMRELVTSAEQQSYRLCRVCGRPGVSTGRGMPATLCEFHEGKVSRKHAGLN